MEIGHNVLHGQWDWMRDPEIHSTTWEWDHVSTAASWQQTHNYLHHTYTNVHGKDRDIGYNVLRVDPDQPWHPQYLFQTVYNLGLALIFEWGIAALDLELDDIQSGKKTWAEKMPEIKKMARKAGKQALKDYVVFPALSGPVVRPGRARRAARQHDPQRVVARRDLLRALPREGARPSTRSASRTSRRPSGTSARCSARRTSRARRCCT